MTRDEPVMDPLHTAVDAEQAQSLAWMAPGHRSGPAEALPRIRAMSGLCPDLFDAMLMVVATHRGVPVPHLAAALKAARPEPAELQQPDVEGLVTATWNGGRQGFDAVWRTRQKAGRRSAAAAMPWSTTDD